MKSRLLLLTLLLSSACAFAGNSYVSVSAGSASQKLSAESGNVSDDTAGFKINGGYQFTPFFGIEAAYIRFGDSSATESGYTAGFKPASVSLAATGTFPVSDKFSVFGKVGVARSNTTFYATYQQNRAEVKEKDTSAVIGVGVKYAFSETVAMVAEYENFGNVAKDDESTSKLKVSLLSVGVRVSF